MSKQRQAMQRVWISLLAAFSASSLGEEAAVAAAILESIVPDATSGDSSGASSGAQPTYWAADCAPANTSAPTAAEADDLAHCAAVRHLIGLWRLGRDLPAAS